MCDVDLNVSTSIDGFTIFAQCRSDDPRLKCITANMDKCGQRNVFTIMAANAISPTLQNCDCMVIKVTVSDLLTMHNFAQILLAIIVDPGYALLIDRNDHMVVVDVQHFGCLML